MTAEPTPHPVAHETIERVDHVDAVRRVLCARYDACLHLAWAMRWRGFACTECEVRELVTLTVPHRVRDLLAEAAQGGSMRGASLYDGAAQKRRQLEAGEKNADDVAKKRRSWVQGVNVERR